MFVKVELWIDLVDNKKSDKYETLEKQLKVFNTLRDSFIANIQGSIKKKVLPDEIKFEYHHQESSHGTHGGGGYSGNAGHGGGGYKNKRPYNSGARPGGKTSNWN
jgi:hypothetical protein